MIHVAHIALIVKFKTTLLNSSLYDYSDAYILVKETITLVGQDFNNHKNLIEVTEKLSLNMIVNDHSNDEANFPKKVLLIDG